MFTLFDYIYVTIFKKEQYPLYIEAKIVAITLYSYILRDRNNNIYKFKIKVGNRRFKKSMGRHLFKANDEIWFDSSKRYIYDILNPKPNYIKIKITRVEDDGTWYDYIRPPESTTYHTGVIWRTVCDISVTHINPANITFFSG